MSAKVKICGLTNKEDAVWALNYGADFLGINFVKASPRHVSAATAAAWVAQLPPFAFVFGIFADTDADEIVKTVGKMNLRGVQLHGNETPADVAALRVALEGAGRKVAISKAIRMKGDESLVQAAEAATVADYLLLDAFVEDALGGTGRRFDWDLAIRAKELGKPVFLAGGLNPDNVQDAVKKVAPFGVDVASGVEKSPKRKDLAKLQDFISRAKR